MLAGQYHSQTCTIWARGIHTDREVDPSTMHRSHPVRRYVAQLAKDRSKAPRKILEGVYTLSLSIEIYAHDKHTCVQRYGLVSALEVINFMQ